MRLHIEPEWQNILAANKLDSYSALLNYRGEASMSSHTRGATWRLTLSGGQVIFIKQDYYTKLQPIMRSLMRLRKPLCNTVKERRAFDLAARHGFIPGSYCLGGKPTIRLARYRRDGDAAAGWRAS
ncbi:MAG TPA: hypothetical protein PKY10_04300 [Lentisphaeria bacterium]|nr:hypothetical protein [Lentisphaeria bacterium]